MRYTAIFFTQGHKSYKRFKTYFWNFYMRNTFFRNSEYAIKSGVLFYIKVPLTPNFYLLTPASYKLMKNMCFLQKSKKGGAAPPLRYEISKNGPRIRDQGPKLPLRTKFHGNRRGVGTTFSDFVWVGREWPIYISTQNQKLNKCLCVCVCVWM